LLQVVFGEEINKEAFEKADLVKSEYCIAVTGEVIKRESPNKNLPTGMVELKGENIKILSESETPPIYIKENLDASENIRLKYRYLDLRRPDMQKILMIRHKAGKVVRDYLDENGFLEMETPMLTKSTPEGARVFKEVIDVDVQLPIKRMPYVEAMNKYGSDKPDLRFGMEIQNITEAVRSTDFAVFKGAIENGGSVRAIVAKNCADMGRKKIDKLGEFVKTYKAKGLAWIAYKEGEIKSPIAKFFSEEDMAKLLSAAGAEVGDLVLIVADVDSVVLQSLGALRLELAKELGILEGNKEFNFVWITEFPMFEYDEEEKRFVALHHPFTAPMDEDLELLETDPGRARAKAYDIVLNGEELGGGSIRIHDTNLQQRIFNLLGFTDESAWERFGFLLEAFKYGPPPHGGLAYGLDRMVMFLAGTDNIKDVITFPKNQNAYCPMSEAPNVVDKKQLIDLGIEVSKVEK